jgi:hypothetical protein
MPNGDHLREQERQVLVTRKSEKCLRLRMP